MTALIEEEKKIVPAMILNDIKYLSVRKLYFDWFFSSGSEVAVQLIDSAIKIYLLSIDREDLIIKIKQWRVESHNLVRIIEMLIGDLKIDYELDKHRTILENIYKLYQARYLDTWRKIGQSQTTLADLETVDYTYKYFRDHTDISDDALKQTLINKLFLQNQDLPWGEDRISLRNLFYKHNKYFVAS